MHHYGEKAVRAVVSASTFAITLKNHTTGAEIILTGPVQGVFENRSKTMDQGTAERLGREVAHLLARILS